MASDERRLEDLASAVLDGTAVDWAAAGSSVDDAGLPLVQHLRTLAAVADVHRTAVADPEPCWGHLRLLERIGCGSFGDVYRAWDTRLDREVALKLLPADAAPGSPSAIHEGRLLARLRHPNIVTIYGAERVDGRIGLWMEFVRGSTLAQLMDDGRVFTHAEVAAMGAELCDALSAVHDAGLLHRDVKAANVMIADGGRLVLMDFGTGADATDASREDLAGTPLYLAPEVLAGAEASVRSDIYSAGVLLYFLLTRTYPVTADSIAGLREAHARRGQVATRRVRREIPASLARILDRALAPRPERRYDTAAALRHDLLSIPRRRRIRAGGLSAAAAVVAAVPVWLFVGDSLPTRDAERGASTTRGADATASPALSRTQRLTQTGDAISAAVSPDGTLVVMDIDQGGRSSLWLHRIASGTREELVPPAPVRYWQPAVGPDGRTLFFLRSNRSESRMALYRQPLDGGTGAQLLYDAPNLQGAMALSPNGQRVALVRNSRHQDESLIVLVDAVNGASQTLARRDFASAYWQLAWSPDGQTLAAAAGNADAGGRQMHLVTLDVDDGSERAITQQPWAFIGQLAWMNDGRGLLMVATDEIPRTDQMWFVAYPEGDARRVTDEADRYRGVSLDATASTLITAQVRARRSIWIVDHAAAPGARRAARLDTTSAREIASGSGGLDWTPQDEIVFESAASGTSNIWRVARDGSRLRQLTRLGFNGDPRTTPDGRTIVFESNRGDGHHLWRMDADGGGAVQLTSGTGEGDVSITPDGAWVIYSSLVDRSIWKVPLQGGTASRLTTSAARKPAVSKDGRWIAYNVQEPSPPRRWKIVIMPTSGGAPRHVFSRPATETRSFELHWSDDGTAITYESTEHGVSNIWSQPLAGGPPVRITDFRSDNIYAFAWSPDGRQLAVLRGAYETDIVLYSLAR